MPTLRLSRLNVISAKAAQEFCTRASPWYIAVERKRRQQRYAWIPHKQNVTLSTIVAPHIAVLPWKSEATQRRLHFIFDTSANISDLQIIPSGLSTFQPILLPHTRIQSIRPSYNRDPGHPIPGPLSPSASSKLIYSNWDNVTRIQWSSTSQSAGHSVL